MSVPPPESVVASGLNERISLLVSSPTIPVGYTAQSYAIYFDGDPSFQTILSWNAGNTTLIFGPGYGIVNGSTYTCAVLIGGIDEFGNGFETTQTVANPATPAAGTPPDPVPINILPRANPTTLEFWWNPVINSGTTPLAFYNLEGLDQFNNWNGIASIDAFASTFYTIIYPGDANSNYFRMTAQNENYDTSTPANFLFTGIGNFPTEPQTPSATRLSATSANVSWTAPVSDGGQAIQYYVVNSLPVTAGVSTVKSLYVTETTVEMTGLSSGIDYTFSIEAVNPPGYSPAAITAPIGP
jgi:hypothetical protein